MAPLSTLCFGFLIIYRCDTAAPETPPPMIVCPPIVQMDAAQQKRIGKRLRELNDADLNRLASAFIEQRDINRRCIEAQSKASKK